MIDTSSLFLHVLAAIGILAGGVVQILAGARLRSTSKSRDVASWARLARTGGFLTLASAVVSLLTGGHLAGAVWTTEARSGFSFPFITLGALGLLLLAPVGPMVGGAQLRRLARSADSTADADAATNVLSAARSPRLWGAVHSLVGVGIGLVALMIYKPSWIIGGLLLVVSFAGGWMSGHIAAARAPRVEARR